MKCHQKDSVIILIHTINIRHQRNFLQELTQRRLIMGFFIGCHLADQLIDIFNPRLCLFLTVCLQIPDISCRFNNILDQIRQRIHLELTAEHLYHIHEGSQLCTASSYGTDLIRLLQCIIKADPLFICIILYFGNRRSTDPSLRDIDDTLYGKIIPSIINRLQICQKILDLFSGIEVHTAYHIIGNTFYDKPLFQKTGLRIGTVKHCTVLILIAAIPFLPCHIICNKFSLFIGIVKLPEMDPLSGSLIGPEGFLLSAYIIPDHSICRIQHILGRAVILLKPDHCCFRIVFFKIQYITDIGSPEFVDRLIIITYNTKILVF